MVNTTGNLALQPKIIETQQDVESMLQSLAGLELNDFRQIIQTANLARSNETANSAKADGGSTFYYNLVKGIRDFLATKGFIRHTYRNIELALHDHIAIAVCKGDSNTANPNQSPRSANTKGEMTLEFFGLTQDDMPLQEKLFGGSDELYLKGGKLQFMHDQQDREVWMLIHNSEKLAHGHYTVKAELSQPATYDNNGYINSFANRIILDLNQNHADNAAAEFTDDIDFKIE